MLALYGDLHKTIERTQASAAPGAKWPLAGRRFLLVTLPAGPFGSRLASHLRIAGAQVSRVILNGGDLVNWGFGDTAWPRVKSRDWRAWVEQCLEERNITDVVVFGDTMSYSAQALRAARAMGSKTWVLENGYNRPDWVTLEPNGVNERSCMPRRPSAYDDVDINGPGPEAPHIGAITPYHVLNLTAYFTGYVLGFLLFPTYRYPYAVPLWDQIFGHIRRYGAFVTRRRAWDAAAEGLVANSRPYFLACLQREGDSQLTEHSELRTNRAFMDRVIASFAASAEPNTRLVFKNHPLDPGVDDLEKTCRAIAHKHGVVDRVVFLQGGAFAPLARSSKGVVAVNSTAAYAALGFAKPVKLLGRAIFDIEGLVDRGALGVFWRRPQQPDLALFARFRRRLSAKTQVPGSFHNPAHLDSTAKRVVERLISLDSSPPLSALHAKRRVDVLVRSRLQVGEP